MELWIWLNQIIGALIYYLLVLAIVIPFTLHWKSPVILVSAYIGSYVIAQYTSPLLTFFGPWIVPNGNIPFVATIALMDIIVVRWGLSFARQVIIAGFLVQILLFATNYYILLTPRPFEELMVLESVYTVSGRVAIASPIAYLAAENVNALVTWIYRRIWWARTLYSDPIALTIDTLIFIPIAFYGAVDILTLINMIIGLALLKIALIPFNLLVVYVNRRFIEDKLALKA
ncbi:MAG: queuosine precursor transporter [Acidilobaceae archaeon]